MDKIRALIARLMGKKQPKSDGHFCQYECTPAQSLRSRAGSFDDDAGLAFKESKILRGEAAEAEMRGIRFCNLAAEYRAAADELEQQEKVAA